MTATPPDKPEPQQSGCISPDPTTPPIPSGEGGAVLGLSLAMFVEHGPFTADSCQLWEDGDPEGAAVFSADGQPFCMVDGATIVGGDPMPSAVALAALLNEAIRDHPATDGEDHNPDGFVHATPEVARIVGAAVEREFQRDKIAASLALTALAAIEELRTGEGNGVTILCDNPEAESADVQCGVECVGDWTDWEPRRFMAATIPVALTKAVAASRAFSP